MESLTNGNATTSILFNDSLNYTLLQSNNESLPSDETTSIFCNLVLGNCGPMQKYPTGNGGGSFPSFLFLSFPVMGFIILVLGSFFERTRIVREDNEVIRGRIESVSADHAAHAAEKSRREGRMKLVEEALVTMKVTFSPEKKSMSSMPCESRWRAFTSTMETNVNDELDSTNLSPCTLRGMVEMAGKESSDNGMIDDDDNERLSDAERGQQSTKMANNITKPTLSPTDSETLSEAQSLEGDPTALTSPTILCDWRAETCAICLEPYKENDDVSCSKLQNCPHVFHKDCILSWLKDEMRNDCPYCRGPYLEICVAEENGDNLVGNDDGDDLTTSVDIARVANPLSIDVTTDDVSTTGVEGSNV